MKKRSNVVVSVMLSSLFLTSHTTQGMISGNTSEAFELKSLRPKVKLAALTPINKEAFQRPQIKDVKEVMIEMPVRSVNAMTGRQFIEYSAGLSGQQREHAIYQQIVAGNTPEFLRDLKEIKVSSKDGRTTVKFWVTPDYLSIGNDQDFVRIPMNLFTADKINKHFDTVLPTKKMVDLIYKNSEIKLKPQPLPPTREMTSNGYYLRHNHMINSQLPEESLGKLIAGHKKDVVMSRVLEKQPNRIAIYGWHRLNARPIQPLSTVHGAEYADYSHGIRLVSKIIEVNGKKISYQDALKDAKIVSLLGR